MTGAGSLLQIALKTKPVGAVFLGLGGGDGWEVVPLQRRVRQVNHCLGKPVGVIKRPVREYPRLKLDKIITKETNDHWVRERSQCV